MPILHISWEEADLRAPTIPASGVRQICNHKVLKLKEGCGITDPCILG